MRTIGLISPGDMGQAVGALLVEGGVRVVTCVAGRSERTRVLARSAGFTELPDLDSMVRESEQILSIVPPAEALTGSGFVDAGIVGGPRHGMRPVRASTRRDRTARRSASCATPVSTFASSAMRWERPRR